jgi:DNA-binding MarR family transcriptional regulator
VRCRISAAGLRLLEAFDGPLDALDDDVLSCLSPRELRVFIRLLDRVRTHQTRLRVEGAAGAPV